MYMRGFLRSIKHLVQNFRVAPAFGHLSKQAFSAVHVLMMLQRSYGSFDGIALNIGQG